MPVVIPLLVRGDDDVLIAVSSACASTQYDVSSSAASSDCVLVNSSEKHKVERTERRQGQTDTACLEGQRRESGVKLSMEAQRTFQNARLFQVLPTVVPKGAA